MEMHLQPCLPSNNVLVRALQDISFSCSSLLAVICSEYPSVAGFTHYTACHFETYQSSLLTIPHCYVVSPSSTELTLVPALQS